jgi:ketosteroid isomerase-like protein
MGQWSREELQRAHDRFIEAAAESGRTGDWSTWADMFTEDATYVEHHYGTFEGRDAIKAWIGETMAQWPNSEMKEFPHDWCVCDE